MYDSCADAVPRGWAYFSGAIWVPVPHPNMLKEWKRLQAGNMPILLDAFYCRDKRLSCLPLTSLPPPIAAPPTSLHATRKIAGETNATSVIFTSVLLTSLMDVPPPFFPHPRERKYAHTVFFDLCRDIWHRPLFFYGAKEEEKRDKRLAIRIKVDGDSDLRKIRKNRRMLIDWYFFFWKRECIFVTIFF